MDYIYIIYKTREWMGVTESNVFKVFYNKHKAKAKCDVLNINSKYGRYNTSYIVKKTSIN